MSGNNRKPNDVRVGWNDAAILEAAGQNLHAVRSLLERQGQPVPSDDALYQMFSRGRISDRWRAPLLYALFREAKIEPGNLFRRIVPTNGESSED